MRHIREIVRNPGDITRLRANYSMMIRVINNIGNNVSNISGVVMVKVRDTCLHKETDRGDLEIIWELIS
jgi:hypothetical protein